MVEPQSQIDGKGHQIRYSTVILAISKSLFKPLREQKFCTGAYAKIAHQNCHRRSEEIWWGIPVQSKMREVQISSKFRSSKVVSLLL